MVPPRNPVALASVIALVLVETTTGLCRAETEPGARAAFPLIVDQSRIPEAPPSVAPRSPPPTTPAVTPARDLVPTEAPPMAPTRAVSPELDRSSQDQRDVSDEWMLALEGVTHAPVDVGVQVGIETPAGLRLSAAYGWVPSFYADLVTGIVASASNADPQATALLQHGFEGGRAYHLQAGIRPFSRLGLYIDAGYSHLTLRGSLDSAEVPGAGAAGVTGGYDVRTTLDFWTLELGYQAHIGRHVVLSLGVGLLATFDARTTATLKEGSTGLPVIGSGTTDLVDRQLEDHRFLPTLNLRLGTDLI